MTVRVHIASCADALTSDEDQPVLDRALHAVGAESTVASWDDPTVDWSAADLVVIRSAWDYASRRDEFCDWADAVGGDGRLHNPPAVVRWNTDKHYLRELESKAVPIVATRWCAPGDVPVLPDADEVVVKPTISAGSKDTTRHDLRSDGGAEAATSAATALLDAGRSAMVQPYLGAVDEVGETGMVFVDGVFHHAFRKAAILRAGRSATDRLYAPEQIEPVEPSGAELQLAADCLAAVPFPAWTPLYARVDAAPGPDGAPVVMELELVEPSLFFAACGRSPDRLVAAVLDRIRSS